MLAVDSVLLSRKDEQHDHKYDQRALRGHVEAEREAEDRNGDLVERHHEHVDDVAEEEPDPEMREHQPGRLSPVCFFIGFIVGRSHGSQTFPHKTPVRVCAPGVFEGRRTAVGPDTPRCRKSFPSLWPGYNRKKVTPFIRGAYTTFGEESRRSGGECPLSGPS